MNKETLESILDKIIKLLEKEDIDILDKVELMININKFLDKEEYENNIKLLSKKK